jgi:hypothetical protein
MCSPRSILPRYQLTETQSAAWKRQTTVAQAILFVLGLYPTLHNPSGLETGRSITWQQKVKIFFIHAN